MTAGSTPVPPDAAVPVPGRLVVVQPSADYAYRVRRHVPDALLLATPSRATELAGHPLLTADLGDPVAAAAAVRAAGGADGIACFVCEHLAATAAIAAELGLAFHSADAVRRSRRKDESLRLWRAAGVPTPATAEISDWEDLRAFAARVPPPWILKPVDRSGSEWVLRVEAQRALRRAHDRLLGALGGSAAAPTYVAQACIGGRELSADLYVDGGRVVEVLRWTEKHLRDEPGLAGLVGAYWPAHPDAVLAERLRGTYDGALAALGVERGVVMVDGILRDGTLHLLEMGLRPGGDCLPDLCRAATGYDPVRATCQAALGLRPDGPSRTPDSIAALHLMADRDGTLTRLDWDGLRAHPAVLQVDAYRDVGDPVRVWAGSYDDRIVAACLARFDTAAELPGLLQALTDRLSIEIVASGAPAGLVAA